MTKVLFIIFTLFLFLACTSEQPATDEAIKQTAVDSIIREKDTIKPTLTLTDGLEIFSNIEQVDFCVPLPLAEYIKDTENEYERAKFVFRNKKKKEYELVLQGMFRADPKVSIDDYFKNTYTEESEAEGKIVTEKQIVRSTSCFYAKGFWSNLGDKQKFLEVTWFRPDDVVFLSVNYDIKDTTTWNNRLVQLIKTDSYCK
ncbi:MAG TPA: hypothetical protein VGF30_14155 [Bacteroidia bacterium]